jgi:predicted nucleotidyltransferase
LVASDDALATQRLGLDEREALLCDIGRAVATVPAVRVAYVFGSFVRDEPFRDVDVAVLFDEPTSWRLAGRVEAALGEHLDPPRYRFEVVPLNDAPPSFRCEVADHGRVVYEREPRAAIELWVRARSELIDLTAWRRAHGVAV